MKKIWAVSTNLFAIMLFFGIILPHCIHAYTLSQWGLYRDAWDSVNALASVAAFIEVLFSLREQYKENENTRTKMRDTLRKQTRCISDKSKWTYMDWRPIPPSQCVNNCYTNHCIVKGA